MVLIVTFFGGSWVKIPVAGDGGGPATRPALRASACDDESSLPRCFASS